jgi:hypothetical protein
MKKGVITALLILIVGIILQMILIETSPKILCNSVSEQMLLLLESLMFEFLGLSILLVAINKFVLQINWKSSLKVFIMFTVIYVITFVYLLNNYVNKCVESF